MLSREWRCNLTHSWKNNEVIAHKVFRACFFSFWRCESAIEIVRFYPIRLFFFSFLKYKVYVNNPTTLPELKDAIRLEIDENSPQLCQHIVENFVLLTSQRLSTGLWKPFVGYYIPYMSVLHYKKKTSAIFENKNVFYEKLEFQLFLGHPSCGLSVERRVKNGVLNTL